VKLGLVRLALTIMTNVLSYDKSRLP